MADLRSRILSTHDLGSEVVHIPEWDVDIEVRGLSGRDRARLQKALTKSDTVDMEDWYTTLVLLTCYDPETGERVFTEEDRDAIAGRSGKVLETIATIATRLAGMVPESVKEAKGELGET